MSTVQWRGVLMVFGAFLVHLTLGTIYTFGNMSVYMASYLRRHTEEVSTMDMTWVYAAILACQGALMCLGGILEKRLGPQLTALLGCTFMSGGTALTYFSVQRSFWLVILTYGAMYGTGISIAYISLISAGMKWFPEKRGVINGIIVGGFGFGAFIFNQVQTMYLNPNNYSPNKDGYFTEEEVLSRVPKVFLLLGGIYGAMQLTGCLMAKRAPNDIADQEETAKLLANEFLPVINNAEAITVVSIQDTEEHSRPFKPRDYTPMEMLQTREFYILFWTMFFNTQTVNFTNAMYKAYGQTFITDDHFLAQVGAIAAVFNASGRILWGVFIDRYTYKTSMKLLCALVIMFLLTMPSTVWGGKMMFAIWICAIYISISGVFVLTPTCVSRQFGSKHMGTNYGLVFSNMVIGGPLTAILTKTMTDSIGYVGMFYLLAGCSSISFLLTILFQEVSW